MLRKPVMLLALALPALGLRTAVAAEAPLAPASQWIPQNAVIVLEVSRPGALLDVALDPKAAEVVGSLPAYQKLEARPGFKQFKGAIDFLQFQLETDWRSGLRKLVGGGVTFAVLPDEQVVLIVDADDAKLLERLHEILLGFARGDAEKQGQPGRVASAEYRGVTGWTFGPKEAHAILGNRLLVANKPEALKAMLDLRAEPNGRNLASSPAYRAAKQAAGSDAVATAYFDLKTLKLLPGLQKALTEGQNPLASLLFAGMTEAVRESTWLAMGLHAQGDSLVLEAAVDGKVSDPTGSAAFALPAEAGKGALPNLSVPRQIAGMSFYRDMHKFYAAKDKLFPERTSGLIFFENMMGIFFSGRDLTEEVLAETKPEIRFVVAEQEYDPAVGTPRVKIPAFAAVLQLRNPEQFSEVVEEGWQTAVGLFSFTRGQQAQPKLIIDRVFQDDVKFTIAYFSSKSVEDRANLDSRFNFRPALAMLDDYLILSSAEGLTRDLIDAVKKEVAGSVKPLAEAHSMVEIDGARLASILGANRESLVRQNMVNEGRTQEEAETQIDLLLALVQYLGQAKLDVGTRDGHTRASLQLKPNLASK